MGAHGSILLCATPAVHPLIRVLSKPWRRLDLIGHVAKIGPDQPGNVGLMLFQRLIPRPGLASGLYTNTRRLAAIVSGPIIAFGSTTAFGFQGVFAACAALTVLALAVIASTSRSPRRMRPKELLAAPAPANPAAGARS